ncbi:MAG: Rrf2 family transcriptional regulator [Bacteroidales bacterium]|nr:Rrf2 family transcriptional regulator [Bacteroidales bacterium]
MKINTKVRYGLRAMIDIAQNPKGVLQKDIAQRQEIPLKYLDSLISNLRNAGLIVNLSGRGSGYRLAENPKRISVYDIYRAFEPELALVNCFCATNECWRTNICPTKDYWFELNNNIKSTMTGTKLSDLMTKVNEKKSEN